MALDLDNFKYVNDSLGHAAGDESIVGVGRLMRERLRKSDILARIGGDEFGVILPRADARFGWRRNCSRRSPRRPG